LLSRRQPCVVWGTPPGGRHPSLENRLRVGGGEGGRALWIDGVRGPTTVAPIPRALYSDGRFRKLTKKTRRKKLTPRQVARLAGELALSKKAEDVLILDMREVSSVADYFVICSGTSEVQVKAIADAVLEGLEKEGLKPWHTEGFTARRWILIDFVDVVVHDFHAKTREYYMLERLWGDAKRIGVG
jgi:ribosome-associated protein